MSAPVDNKKEEAIAKVEEVFDDIVGNLCQERPISISLKYKQRPQKQSGSTKFTSTIQTHSFPGTSPREAWRFTVLFRILGLIHEALTSNNVVSKRNIYYKDPTLFKSQAIVDKYVDVFAYTFGLSRAALNVTAAAKGLVVGHLTITRPDGTTVNKGLDDKPYLIDDPSEISSIQIPNIAWILVVEKESTFRTLASTNLHLTSRSGPGIILTAKGYPDISTRSFLHHLSISASSTPDPNANPSPPPLLLLTDHDPDGIAIASVYTHGSANLSHENAHLTVPTLRWIGVRSGDLLPPSAFDENAKVGGDGDDDDGGEAGNARRMTTMMMMPLTARDRRKAASLLQQLALRRSSLAETKELGIGETSGVDESVEVGVEEWRREVQVMLFLNLKGEMEGLEGFGGVGGSGVGGWVEGRVGEVGGGLGGGER